ncbi:FecCD family ABC transporter permease [Psychromonas aquimarina]|uniref:FecCD family ABC transporter permease n=1 Tax=Psychromonas aquimarina TaxID=444919 RepID=UPI000401BBED|nr:iron chelate uptake ABC transporter family permease subunit [Psychromonas aquimarina]
MSRYNRILAGGFSLLLFLSLISLFSGAQSLTVKTVISTLINGGDADFIINQYRLPRIFIAVLTGIGLAVSGVLTQGIIRNPLASPDLMGISGGAGLSACTVLLIRPDINISWLPPAALLGGFSAALFIWLLNRWHNPSPARLALAGIAVSAFLTSCINFLLVLHPVEVNSAMIWLTGSLWGRSWDYIWPLLPWLIILVPFSFYLAWSLDLCALGDETAGALGVNTQRLQIMALASAVALASVCVAVCGTISFVGLLAPHLARLLVGSRHKLILPAAALTGALLVLSADTLARNLAPPLELPAGVLTAVLGAPYFIFLLHRYKGW